MADEKTRRMQIADTAIALAKKLKEEKAKYDSPATDKTGFPHPLDCSFFVHLVFKDVFNDYAYLNADQISTSALFKSTTSAMAGNVIFFPSGVNPYNKGKPDENKVYPNHVGIVISNDAWVGMQSSGAGLVNLKGSWWSPRSSKFFSFLRLDAGFVSNNVGYLRSKFA